jgi:ribose 5-phosphate isomerase B
MKKVYVASDHGGFYLKEEIKKELSKGDYDVEDLGNTSFDENDDYPDYSFSLGGKVSQSPGSFGIVLGRSGNGEAICANKVGGIRAALCTNIRMAKKAREHNDANVLAMGADYVDKQEALKIVDAFLNTDFSNEERHVRRIKKISEYETSQTK